MVACGQLDDQLALAVDSGLRDYDQAEIRIASELRHRCVDVSG